MQRRRIFFAILIVLTIIMIYDSGVGVLNSIDITVEPKVVQSASASRNESFTIGAENVEVLELVNRHGDVKIIGEDRSDIEIDSRITAYGRTEELAEEYLQQLEIIQHIIDNKVEVKLGEPVDRSITSGAVSDFVIRAPQALVYQLENSHGSVELENLHGGVTATVNYADNINVSNLSGDTNFIIWSSDGAISGINGEFNIDVSYSELNVTQVSDTMNLISRYSDIGINGLANDLVLDSSYDDLIIENIGGSIIGQSRYSSVNGIDYDRNKDWKIKFSEL